MRSQLQSENFDLRQQLELLLNEARLNEDKMRRFDQLERKLIGAESLADLVTLLLTEYQRAFGVESVTLALIDNDYEIARVLEEASADNVPASGLQLLQSAEPLVSLYKGNEKPLLGRFEKITCHTLFEDAAHELASVALLPLVRNGRLIGSFNLGSSDPARYVSGFGTDFLERLAEIVSVCLDSAMANERLKLLGLTDGLTGVQNRRYFERRLREEVSLACRHNRTLSCMFLDIDRFKRINDTCGHQTGDAVLRNVANLIQGQLRVGDTLARFGGEEFVVLLPRTAAKNVLEVAERIRDAVARKAFETTDGAEISVTISIGLSMLQADVPSNDQDMLADRLVAAADRALYQAKHTGRNRTVCDSSIAPTRADQPSASIVQACLERFKAWSALLAARRLPRFG